MIERIISFVAPHRCLACESAGELLCEPCMLTGLIPPPSRCFRCHTATQQQKVCQKCSRNIHLNHVWVATYYQETAKDLLHKYKFERSKAASTPISMSLDVVLPDLPKEIIVTHIPTANKRVRTRGYDQSKLIAKKLEKSRGWKHQTLLMRKGSSRQVGSSRSERFKQIETALIPINIKIIRNAHILIIDDVTTTGATLEAAAKILKSSGAKTIDAAVFAQAID